MNPGKKFEQLFQDSCIIQGISCTRLRDAGYRGEQSERRFTIKNICDFICYGGGQYLYFIELKSRKKAIPFKDLTQLDALIRKDNESHLNKCMFIFEFQEAKKYYIYPAKHINSLQGVLSKKSFNAQDAAKYMAEILTYIPAGKRKARLCLDNFKD